MANDNAPFGLRPVRHLGGAGWNGRCKTYYAPASYGTAIFPGDPVVLTGTANTAAYLGNDIATLPEVNVATAGTTNLLVGVVVAVVPVTADSLTYREASTERALLVCDDPDVIFEIQAENSTALGAVTVGLNAVLKSGSGSTATGLSGWTMDAGATTAPGTTIGYQLKIMGAPKKVNNEPTAVASLWEVLINGHLFNRPLAGV